MDRRRTKIPNLSIDIINSILLELPVKSLLRFKITCKSWCCTIDEPYFIKSHLVYRSSTDISRKIFLFFDVVKGKKHCDSSIKVLSTEAPISADSKLVPLGELNIPGFRSKVRHLEVSSCSGLVFIYHPDLSMILWNPAIQKYKRIPMPNLLQHKPCFEWPKFGFAYDFVAEDYKILCVHVVTRNTVNYPRYIVELYSVKNQSWRTIHNIFPVPDFPLYLNYNDLVSLNGDIHILAASGDEDSDNIEEYEHSIVTFHLADEKFIVTPVPSNGGKHLNLRALGDRVCFIETVGAEISIWSLEKEGKTGLLTWNYISKFPSLSSVIGKPIEYSSGDVICVNELNGNILWRKYNGRFILYNARINEYIEFNRTDTPLATGKIPLYVESLVSLKIPWD